MAPNVKVGSYGKILEPTLSITADTYTAGELLGPLLTISGPAAKLGGSFVIEGASLFDQKGQNPSVDMIFFNDNPLSTTFTDAASLTVDPNDHAKIEGVIHISDWTVFNASGFGQDKDANLKIQMPSSQNTLYMAMITRTALSVVAATSDFGPKLHIMND